jgi:hypothetical protein
MFRKYAFKDFIKVNTHKITSPSRFFNEKFYGIYYPIILNYSRKVLIIPKNETFVAVEAPKG